MPPTVPVDFPVVQDGVHDRIAESFSRIGDTAVKPGLVVHDFFCQEQGNLHRSLIDGVVLYGVFDQCLQHQLGDEVIPKDFRTRRRL